MINSITLLGSSSGRNAGDAALISGIMDSIDCAFHGRLLYEIPTINPSYVYHNYQNRVRAVGMMPWHMSVKMLGLPTYQSLMRTELSLIFDAILFDKQLYNPLFNYLSTVWLMLPHAKRRGKKLGCFNVGVGPVHTARGQSMLRDTMELMDFITVRDTDSYNLLKAIGVKNERILITADAALNVPPSSPERVRGMIENCGLSADEEIVAINISAYLDTWAREQALLQDKAHGSSMRSDSTSPIGSTGSGSIGKDRFIQIAARALERVSKEIKAQFLFVCTQHHDVPVTRALMNAISTPVRRGLISNVNYNHYDMKGVLGQASLLFGMRLHATILATSMYTPSVALPHQPKVNHYFKTIGMQDYVLTFEAFSEDAMTELLLRGWSQRQAMREQLIQRIPVQQGRAALAADLVLALHRGDNMDEAMKTFSARLAETPGGAGIAFESSSTGDGAQSGAACALSPASLDEVQSLLG